MKVKELKVTRDKLYATLKEIEALERLFKYDFEVAAEIEKLVSSENVLRTIVEVRTHYKELLDETDEKIDNAEVQE